MSRLALLLLLPILAIAVWWIARDARQPVELAPRGEEQPAPAAAAAPAATQPGPDRAPAAPSGRAALEPAALVGQVVDDQGQPVAMATVRCTGRRAGESEPERDFTSWEEIAEQARAGQVATETVSDAQGAFRLVPPPETEALTLAVRAVGFQERQRDVAHAGTEDLDVGRLALERGVVLSGRIVTAGGAPVAGARVWRGATDFQMAGLDLSAFEARDPHQGEATDAEGRFVLGHERPGKIVLRAAHPDHPAAKLEVGEVAAGERREQLLLTLDAGATIQGVVQGLPAGQRVRVVAIRAMAKAPDAGAGLLGGLAGDIAGELLESFGGGPREREVEPADDGTFALRGLLLGQRYQVHGLPAGKGLLLVAPCTERIEAEAGDQGLVLHWDPGITVTVHVVDDRSGAGVERLSVQPRLVGASSGGLGDLLAAGLGRQRFESHPGGRVTIGGLHPKPRQDLTLRVEALGYQRFERESIVLPAQGTLDLGHVRLTPCPVVRVLVTRASGGAPVGGATVELVPEALVAAPGGSVAVSAGIHVSAAGETTLRGTTGTDGWCTVNSVPGRPARITVVHQDFAPYRGEPWTPAAQADEERRAALVAGGTIEVTVHDGRSTPVPAAEVVCRGLGASHHEKADAAGLVRFAKLAPGRYSLELEARHRRAGGIRVDIGGSGERRRRPPLDEVDVLDGQVAAITLVMPASGGLIGVVRENGLPLARARVTWVPGPGQDSGDLETAMAAMFEERLGAMLGDGGARTDRDGRYALAELPVGAHRLRITHGERAMPAVVPCEVREGSSTLDIELEVSAITGRVLGPDGTPVRGARVSVAPAPKPVTDGEDRSALAGGLAEGMGMAAEAFGLGGDAGTRTDDDGAFELRGVQPATPLVVRAMAKGLVPGQSTSLEVARGGTTGDVEIALEQGGRIQVRAEGLKGPFVAVHARPADGAKRSGTMAMLRAGRALLDGLAPGRWTVELGGIGDERRSPQTVEVRAGETVEVRL